MRDDPYVVALVARAAAGDQTAWDEIVERYAPLVWKIGARYRLSAEDIADVGQKVWLLSVEKLGSLREPAALPGWLARMTQRECLHVLGEARRHGHAELPPEDQMPTQPDTAMIEEEILLAERNAALRTALAELPHNCRELLSMMICDPPCKYEDISATLGMKMGSIGPLRARCLERLRHSPHLAAIIDTGSGMPAEGGW
jgi:RNA polymerase sigma factor (sigma-70 family)